MLAYYEFLCYLFLLFYRKPWLQSFEPYNITLSVKDLQNVLSEDQSMSPQYFNIAVCLAAYSEFRKLTYCSNNIPKHFMDLRLCVSFLPSFTHPQCYSH